MENYSAAMQQGNVLGGAADVARSAYLDCVPIHVERLEKVRAMLGDFVGRFDGPQPCGVGENAPQPPICHRTNLDRLSAILGDVEDLARGLQRIG